MRDDAVALTTYGADALKRGHPAGRRRPPGRHRRDRRDRPALRRARACRSCRAAPAPATPAARCRLHGGVVLSLERMNRILEIDEANLLAVVEPNVITGDLQAPSRRVGLFYPPDPASLQQSSIGGNVAECAGGPRAFKYGTTKRYVLGAPSGAADRRDHRDRRQGRQERRRLRPDAAAGRLRRHARHHHEDHPAARAEAAASQSTLRATFSTVADAVAGRERHHLASASCPPRWSSSTAIRSTRSRRTWTGVALAPAGTGALLLLEVDGPPQAAAEDADRVRACVPERRRDRNAARAQTRRSGRSSGACGASCLPRCKTIAPLKFNHDVVVPKGRIPQLFDLIERLKRDYRLRIAVFRSRRRRQHPRERHGRMPERRPSCRAREAGRRLFEGVVALEGSISGEHGIGLRRLRISRCSLGRRDRAHEARQESVRSQGNPEPGKIFDGH